MHYSSYTSNFYITTYIEPAVHLTQILIDFPVFTADIFADSSSTTVKPKKSKKSQRASAAAAAAAFDKDAPNIFDDPLSALDS